VGKNTTDIFLLLFSSLHMLFIGLIMLLIII
jgi:hypothetical protein